MAEATKRPKISSPLEFIDEFGYGGAPKVSPFVSTKALHEAHLVENLELVLRRRIWRIVRELAGPTLLAEHVAARRERARELSDLISAMREAHRAWKAREDAAKSGDRDQIISPYADEASLIASENAAEDAAKAE